MQLRSCNWAATAANAEKSCDNSRKLRAAVHQKLGKAKWEAMDEPERIKLIAAKDGSASAEAKKKGKVIRTGMTHPKVTRRTIFCFKKKNTLLG